MKLFLIFLAILTTLFSKVNDQKLYQKLKNYDDNTTMQTDNNITNKVLIKKKETKIDKIISKNIKKIKVTKFTKNITKEAPKK